MYINVPYKMKISTQDEFLKWKGLAKNREKKRN